MWWYKGRRCRWWDFYPSYLPYVQAPQQTAQHPSTASYLPYPFASFPSPTPEQEIEVLKAYREEIEEEFREVEARLKELNETSIKEE